MDDALLERCADLLAQCGDHCAICLVTAAQLHEFWLPDLRPALHVAVADRTAFGRDMLRSRLPGVQGHRRQLRAADFTTLHGVAVTTPERTWVDLASWLDLPSLVAAGDSMLRAGVSRSRVQAAVGDSIGRRGVRRARVALDLLDERSRSRPESHLRVATIAPDLPRLDVNAAVSRDEGGWLAEPDLSLPAAKIALEYQGSDHAELSRMRRDITRNVDLRRAGWVVLPYGPAEVFGRPWQIAPELRVLIRQRRPELLGTERRPRRRRVVTSASSGRRAPDHSGIS